MQLFHFRSEKHRAVTLNLFQKFIPYAKKHVFSSYIQTYTNFTNSVKLTCLTYVKTSRNREKVESLEIRECKPQQEYRKFKPFEIKNLL